MKLKKGIFLILLVLLMVGFATVSTVLYFNGAISINTSDFDVYFSGAILDGIDKSNELIVDKKNIVFTSNSMSKIGDKTVLEYEVTNGSKQYDADITISCISDEKDKLDIVLDKTNFILIAGDVITGKIEIELLKGVVEEENISINCELKTNPLERTSVGDDVVPHGDYAITGYFVNEDGFPVSNAYLTVYSDVKHIVKTDIYGYFHVEGLERGEHEIYYLNSLNPQNMTKDEIINSSYGDVKVATNENNTINFTNNYRIVKNYIENNPQENKYLITLNKQNDTPDLEYEVIQHHEYGELPEIYKEGYNFNGWYLGDKLINEHVYVYEKHPHTLIAKWKPNDYYIVFNANGGALDKDKIKKNVTFDSTIGELPIPTRIGFDFKGWKYDNKVINNTMTYKYADNIEVVAEWEEVKSPVIAGGSENWNNKNVSINIEKGGSAYSGVKNYEYYVTNSDSIPDYNVSITGVTDNISTISNEGINYIFYRTVSNDGNKSNWSNNNIVKIDKTVPTINSITPQNYGEIENNVKFNTTDNTSQIAYYNISSSNQTPTIWIPVTSMVEENTSTKNVYNASWARVFYHDSYNSTNYFANEQEALLANSNYKYSVLSNLENYRLNDNKFEFLLEYPQLSLTKYNRWKQSINPTKEYEIVGDGTEFAPGYEAINIDWNTYYWGGIARSTTTSTFIDGSYGHNNWYYAIGSYGAWNGGIPGPNPKVDVVNLWIKINDNKKVTKQDLTATVGGIRENGTYYIFVKDAAGNIASKEVNVQNVEEAVISPPSISGASATWSSSKVFTISNSSTLKGVKRTEYYISDSSSVPSSSVSVTGSTTSSSLTIKTNGKYIFFRTIGNTGKVGVWSDAYNLFVDSTGPDIGTITPSKTKDKTNYASFSSSDSYSGIAYYNVSTSTKAPTTWIPVTNFVESSTATKYEFSASWARILHHNARSGTIFFNTSDAPYLITNPDKYSVLKNVENYKNSSGYFEFLLQYPDYSSSQYNRWKQRLNPYTTTEVIGTGSEFVPGYSAIHIDWSGNFWGGIAKSTSGATLIDGSYGHGNWFYAIGDYSRWDGSVPGPGVKVDITDLWVRIDDKTSLIKNQVNATIGGLNSNRTYYLFVKDQVGNVSYKAFNISNVT